MTIFSPADLASMRADVNRLLPDAGTILSYSAAPDGSGGSTPSYAAIGTTICRVDPLPKRDKIELLAASPKMMIDYLITFPYGTAIDVHYRVQTGGNTYEITGLAKDHSWAVSVRAYISRVK